MVVVAVGVEMPGAVVVTHTGALLVVAAMVLAVRVRVEVLGAVVVTVLGPGASTAAKTLALAVKVRVEVRVTVAQALRARPMGETARVKVAALFAKRLALGRAPGRRWC